MRKQISEDELSLLIKQLNLEELNSDLVNETFSEAEEHIHESAFLRDGAIQVKKQKIIVHDPINGGKLPVISSAAPVKLFINDVLVESEATVSSTDRIHWEIDERALFDIRVTTNRLSAYFHLYSKESYAWQLDNIESASRVHVTAKEDKSRTVKIVEWDDIAAIMEQKSIKSNLNSALIEQELRQPTYQPIGIAKGKMPIPGKDAQLEIYFSEQVETQYSEVSGSVDFRNYLQIPSVKKGELIAKKIPMVDGVPGYDVHGDVILPTPPKDIFIVAKSGVELTPHGEIFAKKEGRPRITGNRIKIFDISTTYIVAGDVDLGTGNIFFSGDVVIYGNVTDHMIVESLGNVYVYGSVFNATITATGSIHVGGNVAGSKLYSGYYGVMFNRLYATSKMLRDHIRKLITAAGMLEQALESRQQTIRFGQIVQLLIESKLKEIPDAVKELLSVISNIQQIKKDEYQTLMEMAIIFVQPAKLLETATVGFLHRFLELLHETHHEVARMQEEKVQTIIKQCHNSELKTNGDIIVQRDGVILSDVYSAGNILFTYELAVCRGAKLKAEGMISAKIVGGQTGAKTYLNAKKITVKKMYEGQVCVGNYCADIYELVENKTFDANNMKRRA